MRRIKKSKIQKKTVATCASGVLGARFPPHFHETTDALTTRHRCVVRESIKNASREI
tara:strand:- start:84 stop:254 length:171 start_codon:yes stop_codon:yes gene_type:complete